MKGDFSRWTFRPGSSYTGVLMQQGRVQTDADWNEQVQIQNEQLRVAIRDLIGPHGGPDGADFGFEIAVDAALPFDFTIGPGRYYVEGALCRNGGKVKYSGLQGEKPPVGTLLVYLETWEQGVNAIEDPSIADVALNGLDTTARSQRIWQVRTAPLAAGAAATDQDILTILNGLQPGTFKLLPVIGTREDDDEDECLPGPLAKYRGLENQLYRVEIHLGSKDAGGPTFKWSRDNGSVVAAIDTISGATIRLTKPPRDRDSGFDREDWVEVLSGSGLGKSKRLYRVVSVDVDEDSLTVDNPVDAPESALYLRRWDQRVADDTGANSDGVAISADPNKPVYLEDGLSVKFQSGAGPANYRAGDYWLIPARVATGTIDWPKDIAGNFVAMPPRGVQRGLAPLASIDVAPTGAVTLIRHLRKKFSGLAQ